jgi:hypothetical protein
MQLLIQRAHLGLAGDCDLIRRDQSRPGTEDGDEGEEEERLLLAGRGHGGRIID